MSKKKKKRLIIISISAILLILGVYKIVDATSFKFVSAKAEHYLCQKYDADASEFELVDYEPAHIFWDEYEIFFQRPVWIDFTFEYKYKNRNFVVNRQNGEFYDDYQLVDLENWCVKWLKENIDDRIVSVDLTTTDVIWYQKNVHHSFHYIFKESDAEDFLYNYVMNPSEREYCRFLYYDPCIEHNSKYEEKLKIKTKIATSLHLSKQFFISILSNEDLDKEKYKIRKYTFDIWETRLTSYD